MTQEVKEKKMVPQPVGKIITLAVAPNNREARPYLKKPYMSTPIWDQKKGVYLTGREGMNATEIAKRNKIFPIDPFEHYPVTHLMKLDLNGERDQYFLEYLLTQPRIAASKVQMESNPGKYYFYIVDTEGEAESSLSLADKIFEAEDLVRSNLAHKDYKSLGIWLGIDVGVLTDTQLKDSLVGTNGVVRKSPGMVIQFFDKNNSDILFVKELAHYKIIYKDSQGRGFYTSSKMEVFLGMTFAEVVSFMRKDDNEPYLIKWSSEIKEKKETL